MIVIGISMVPKPVLGPRGPAPLSNLTLFIHMVNIFSRGTGLGPYAKDIGLGTYGIAHEL